MDKDEKIYTYTYFELLLNGLSELIDFGLDAVRELTVVLVHIPQKTGQRLC